MATTATKGKTKETPLPETEVHKHATAAARNGMLSVLRELVAADPETTVSEKDELGMSALAWAARNGHLAIVEFLIESGADVDAVW